MHAGAEFCLGKDAVYFSNFRWRLQRCTSTIYCLYVQAQIHLQFCLLSSLNKRPTNVRKRGPFFDISRRCCRALPQLALQSSAWCRAATAACAECQPAAKCNSSSCRCRHCKLACAGISGYTSRHWGRSLGSLRHSLPQASTSALQMALWMTNEAECLSCVKITPGQGRPSIPLLPLVGWDIPASYAGTFASIKIAKA